MKLIHSILIGGLLSVTVVCAINAQTSEDFALLKKVSDATRSAPASRITHTVTDRDSGSVLESTVMERVLPDEMHFVTTRHGQIHDEMIFDGKRSLRRKGPNGPWKPLPLNLAKLMSEAQAGITTKDIADTHPHLKLVGNEQVNGVAANVYEMTDDNMGASKVWIAADNFRMLKMERDYDDVGPLDTPKFDGDLKSLQAQLKTATTKHHLHSLDTYVYDPSIKITMPAK